MDDPALFVYIKCTPVITFRYPEVFYWLNLSDMETEGQFVWSDGSALEYELWFPGSPSMVPEPSGDGDCACASSDDNFLWFDRPCTENYRALCQLVSPTEPGTFVLRWKRILVCSKCICYLVIMIC